MIARLLFAVVLTVALGGCADTAELKNEVATLKAQMAELKPKYDRAAALAAKLLAELDAALKEFGFAQKARAAAREARERGQ